MVGRSGDTDWQTYKQIFVEREYGLVTGLKEVSVIVDLGANVGYSSAFFLTHFPGAKLIAVEPDPANLRILKLNLSAYRSRARIVHAAIWSDVGWVSVRYDNYRGGGSWARQFQRSEDVIGAVPAVDIPWILERFRLAKISLLKIDVEGAEVELFSNGVGSWIDKVTAIVIELHDDSYFGNATDLVLTFLRSRGFEFQRSGEFVLCTRRSLGQS